MTTSYKTNDSGSERIFILGCERSGSTWLSNILSSHEDVQFIMEPFAKQLNIFPDFPERNQYMEEWSSSLSASLRRRINDLPRLQYPFFYRPGRPLFTFSLDRMLLASMIRFCDAMARPLALTWRRYKDLSLTMHRPNSGKLWVKNRPGPISRILIKELRLNFKLSLLVGLFPKAKYIVTIRNPAGQITSILDRMQRGSLQELRESLNNLPLILGNPRFRSYQHLLKNWSNKSLESKLSAWWLINYQTLIKDLQESEASFKLVYHEEISKQTAEQVDEVFNFLQLEKTGAVLEYVQRSSSSSQRQEFDTLDTMRNSRVYFKQRIEQASASLLMSIQDAFASSDLIQELEPYRIALNGCREGLS